MKKEVKIGIFAVAILLCSWAGIRFLSGLDVFSRNKIYYADYNAVSGVQIASPVMIRGVKVGQVSAITLDPTKDVCVELTLSVQRKYRIPADSHAKIANNGLLGGKVVELELGNASESLQNGGRIKTSEEADIMSMAGSEIGKMRHTIGEVVGSLTAALNSINALVEANQKSINGVITHLDSMTGNLDNMLANRKSELQDLVTNLATFSEALSRNGEKIDTLLLNVNTISGQFAEADIAGNLQMTLAKLNMLLDSFSEGDGTAAKFMNDKELYDNLTAASMNLSSLLSDIEANPKRYVHFSIFGRGAKAAEKEHEAAQAGKE